MHLYYERSFETKIQRQTSRCYKILTPKRVQMIFDCRYLLGEFVNKASETTHSKVSLARATLTHATIHSCVIIHQGRCINNICFVVFHQDLGAVLKRLDLPPPASCRAVCRHKDFFLSRLLFIEQT